MDANVFFASLKISDPHIFIVFVRRKTFCKTSQ